MANYIFKKEAQLYLVHSGTKYKIDTNEISFSQSFQEKSYEVKTLHNQVGFEGSNINRANPAEFSFNTPLLEEVRHKVVFDRLLDCTTFDLYISSGQDVFKLEKCVIQDGTFEINKSRPLRLSISGEASKLSKYIPTGTSIAATAITGKYVYITALGNTDFTTAGAVENKVGHIFTANSNASGTGTVVEVIPGTLREGDEYDITTYIIPQVNTLTIGGTDISSDVVALSVEVQNDISWNKYNTIQGAVTATNAATSMFPNNFTVGTRVVAGSITKYLKGGTNLLTWNTNTALRLKAWNTSDRGLDFNITNCSFTNRFQDSEVFLEEYSWRMTQRPTAAQLNGTVITYTT